MQKFIDLINEPNPTMNRSAKFLYKSFKARTAYFSQHWNLGVCVYHKCCYMVYFLRSDVLCFTELFCRVCYRNWYQYWGHCCLINDLGSSPQPEGEARGLWWASQVVNETTMTEIEVSISILSWWNQIIDEETNTVNLNAQICRKTAPGYSMVSCAHFGVMWPDCFSLVTRVATTVMSQ